MIWLRKGFVHFLSLLLLVCLLVGVAALGFSRSLSHPANLESWLSDSKIYDHLTAAELVQAQQSSSVDGNSGSVSFSDPAVQQAAEQAFSPELLQNSAKTFINSNYSWLSGKTATPTFTVDLTSAKQNFAELVGQYAETHLANLPICSDAQLAQLTIPVDSLRVACRPATLSPQAENARITQAINDSGDFLSNPVITADTLGQDVRASHSEPYYQRISWAPKAYQIILKLPWILGGLALLSALGILFIAPSRRRGTRRIGAVLLVAGIILIAEKLVADALVKKFANVTLHSTLASQLKQPINDFLRKSEPQLAQTYLWFGILFLVIALAIFIFLFKTRDRPAKPNAPDTPSRGARAVTEAPQTDARDIQLAPHRDQPDEETPDLRPLPPRPTPTGHPPIGKNPPRPKRPRLIQ